MSDTTLTRPTVETADPEVVAAAIRDAADRLGESWEGIDLVRDWLASQLEVPSNPAEWPCLACAAEPDEVCVDRVGELDPVPRDVYHGARGFSIGLTDPGESGVEAFADAPADVCTPTVEHGPGYCYRGRCLGCGWRSRVVLDENAGVELAHDHAWPGWRDLPVVPQFPSPLTNTSATKTQMEKLQDRWWDEAAGSFPEGWLVAGGPVVVDRSGVGGRHVPGRGPFGGYELAAGAIKTTPPEGGEVDDGLALEPTVDQAAATPATTVDVEWLFREDGDLTADQAREVVAKAKGYASQLYRIVGRAHERRIWLALGYGSWRQFVEAEFDIGRSRAYQLVNQYQVNEALVAGESGAANGFDLGKASAPAMSEAQARPLGALRDDPAAVRQVWEWALRESRGTDPTKALMEQAVQEYLSPSEFAGTDEPLVANRVVWASGPVWWWWKTPAAGTVLYVGLGELRTADELERSAYFRSEPRIGKPDEIRWLDAAALLPWVIAELLAGGNTVPDPAVVLDVADLEFTYMDRGPHTVDKQVLLDVVELDTPATDWVDIDDDDSDGDDEVLRGDLVDRSSSSPTEAPTPPGPASGSDDVAAGAGEERDQGPEPQPVPATTIRVTRDDVVALSDEDLVETMARAAEIARSEHATPDDIEEVAAWGRAFASAAMDRKAELERAAATGWCVMPGEWIGVILDGKGEAYGWVGRSPVSGTDELVQQRWDAHQFTSSASARLAASKLLARLAHDPVFDLYHPVAVEAEVRV